MMKAARLTDGAGRGLTVKEARFCEEYLVDLNATQAAIRAGYSKRTAASIGSRLLSWVKIESRISELNSQRSQRTGFEADQVLEELAMIAFADASGVRGLQVTARDKIQALDRLGRHLGLFDTGTVSPDQVEIVVDLVSVSLPAGRSA